jgi:hypothetical protein
MALDNPNFENFWSLESVFALGSVNVRDVANASPPPVQAANFYSALQNWDQKLRSGIRSFDGDLSPVEISLRQDVFELADVKTVNGQTVALDLNPLTNPDWQTDKAIQDTNIRRFQNLLLNHGRYFQQSTKFRGFLLPFSLSYYDVGFTGGRLGQANLFTLINAWNFRVQKFKVKAVEVPGKSAFTGSSTPIYFAQAGLVSNIDFFERASGRVNTQRRVREFNLDNFVRYNKEDLGRTDNAPYLLFSIAKKNAFPTDQEIPAAADMLKLFWSPFCSEWLLEFAPRNDLEIENLQDIVLEMTVDTGVPNPPVWIN